MRMAAVMVLSVFLSACGGNSAINDWRRTAMANCEKQADPIQRQTCREQVQTVTATHHEEDDRKKR